MGSREILLENLHIKVVSKMKKARQIGDGKTFGKITCWQGQCRLQSDRQFYIDCLPYLSKSEVGQ